MKELICWRMITGCQYLSALRLHLKRSSKRWWWSIFMNSLYLFCFSCCLLCKAPSLIFDSFVNSLLLWHLRCTFGVAFSNTVSLLGVWLGKLRLLLAFFTIRNFWSFFCLIHRPLGWGDRFFCRLQFIDLSCHIVNQSVFGIDDRSASFTLPL